MESCTGTPQRYQDYCFLDKTLENSLYVFQVRGDTVQHYTITYEQLTPKHTQAKTVTKAKSPYILENLGIIF